MLQEATRASNSAFNNSFVKKLSLYLHDCVREEVKSSTFRNLKSDKDNKWIFLKEDDKLFTSGIEYQKFDGSDSKLTELMIQSELNQKEKYLIYGYLFLVGGNGKNRKRNEFLTPLLYMPCKLKRHSNNINCMHTDEFLSLKTGALKSLMQKNGDEEEMEQLVESLLDVVPQLPITEEKMEIFLTTLKSIIPDIEVKFDHSGDVDEDNLTKDTSSKEDDEDSEKDIAVVEDEAPAEKTSQKYEKISLTNQCAIILTKRPSVTAGVLHELIQIAEKPSGVYRETVLNMINEEYIQAKSLEVPKPKKAEFYPITPLALSDSQSSVIENVENSQMVSVCGPPGTGKSQTIVNLVAHLIANGKTVLVASRMDKAVDVVAQRLNELGAPFLALRAGRLNYQKQLSFKLQDLIAGKVDIDTGYDDAILADVDDMHDLLRAIKELENKCEKIIVLEKEWQEIVNKKKSLDADLHEREFINIKLKKEEVDEVKKVVDNIQNNLEKAGLFTSISNTFSAMKLKKILGINSLPTSCESIMRLSLELQSEELDANSRIVETRIHKIGNIHQILQQIRDLKKKQRILAVDILKNKRRESLKGLLRDQIKRQRLIIHTKAIVERKQNLQNRLLEDEDFHPLLEAFPCWCVTTYAVSGSLPMKSGLFDVAIIDEASQCDIASCFPIIDRKSTRLNSSH